MGNYGSQYRPRPTPLFACWRVSRPFVWCAGYRLRRVPMRPLSLQAGARRMPLRVMSPCRRIRVGERRKCPTLVDTRPLIVLLPRPDLRAIHPLWKRMTPQPRSPPLPHDLAPSKWGMLHLLRIRRQDAEVQMERNLDQDDAESRDHFRRPPYDPADATPTTPYVSTPNDIENALRNPAVDWPAYEVMSPLGNPRVPPTTRTMRCAIEGISPLLSLLRGPIGPVTMALDAYGAKRVPPPRSRRLDGARKLEIRIGRAPD